MRRVEVLNQLREDLVEVLDELNGITRNKRKLSKTSIARVASLNAEASTIRGMIRHLERKDP